MFFVDSADPLQIKELCRYGLVDGVTTNPTLIKRSGGDYKLILREICSLVRGPVSAEVVATDCDGMLQEGLKLCQIANNIVVKVPCTKEGLAASYQLKKMGKSVNVTLCFSAAQAVLAAKTGADYISPFLGRIEDIGHDGVGLIEDIADIYSAAGFETKILAASIRSVSHVLDSLKSGADVVTAPPKILHQMFDHPLTEKGLDTFLKDWSDTKQKIC